MTIVLDKNIYQSLLSNFSSETIANGTAPADIKFRLFDAPNSVCSQKVRAVLFHHRIGFETHLVDIFKGQNYSPDYVKARLRGCEGAGLDLARVHTGSTSARITGCDACVVPTLIDCETRSVIVDSISICRKIDEARPTTAQSLIPHSLNGLIMNELELVDELPNYPLLGAAIAKKNNYVGDGNPFAASKIARCDKLILKHKDDADLVLAYSAKRDKEQSADKNLFTPQALEAAYAKMEFAIAALDKRLQLEEGPGLFGDQITLADLFWAVELVRSDDLSMSHIWSHNRMCVVAAYYEWLQSLPSVQSAILNWPGARMHF